MLPLCKKKPSLIVERMSTNKKTLIDGDFQVGSNHFKVDTENNYVGFNNATPQNKIDVQIGERTGTHSTGKPLYVTGVTSTSGAEFVSDDGTAGIGIGSSNIFATETNQNISITPDGTGAVGIKTATPNPSGETFDLWVQGDTKITGNVTVNEIYGDGSGLFNVAGTQWVSSSEDIYFLNNTGSGEGKVGIGKTVPEYKLDILDSDKPTIRVKSTSTGDGDALLILDSSATGESDIDFNHDGVLNWRIRTGDAASSGTTFQLNNANDSDVLTIQQNGNVGVGTNSPNVPLEVNKSAGGEMFRLATSTGTLYAGADANPPWFGTSSDDHLRLVTNGTEKIRIESGGNVGIGITSPDSKLEVRGNIQASFSDTDHGLLLESAGTLRRDYGGNGAGFHFTANAIWPTNYLGSYSAGGIDFGNSSYRWNNVYTEALNASSTIYLGTSASIRQSSTIWTGNPGTDGKLEYHNRTWYAVSGSDSNNIMIFRRDGYDQSFISNEGNLMRTTHSNGYLVGSQNNVGGNDAKTNPIYTIGNSHRPNDTSLVNMYGIGFSHGNFTNVLRTEEGWGWGLYVAADGDARIGLNGGTGSIKMICEENGDSYAWNPANDGWLRLQGGATGQGNMYGNYTSLAVGNFYAAGAFRFSSDDRVKHFEEEIPNALELIQQLRPYKYKKTSKIYDEDYTGDIGEDWEWEIGLIAQDVEKIPYLEHIVSKPENNAEGKYGLNYTQFIGVCIQGIKDMDKELQAEKAKTNNLETQLASVLARLTTLENN